MLNSTTLEINLNEEYKIKIENGNQFDQSIFSDVYTAALNNVLEIVKQSEKDKNSKYDDFNNIIAFTGERGKGKSSSMISFRDAIVNKSEIEHRDFFNKPEFEFLKNKSFAEIDIIDPSLFRGESLFEIILAKMFQKFQTKIKESNNQISQDDKRALIKHFQEVYENLQIINSDRIEIYKKESIEALSKLAASSNLRQCFKNLVFDYLLRFEEGKNYLVISIDDFDLNVSGTYEMLEDIRQFLIQSNIILLVACKIEQLKDTVIGYYKKLNIDNELNNKAKRYIDKIIPFNRRNNLPDVRKLYQRDFKIIQNGKTVFENKDTNFKISILKLIYNEVDLFQGLDTLNQNSIIPETIRQTQNFASVIFSEDKDKQLISYIIEESKFDEDLHLLINELDNISDDLFFLILIRKLLKLNTNKNLEISERSERGRNFRRLLNVNIPDRISIGDINYLLREYENTLSIDDYNLYSFLNYLKAYISLRIKKINSGFIRYGYFNNLFDLLPKENSKYSRDYFEVNKSIVADLGKLTEVDNIFFSLWVKNLGEGYLEYRHLLNKDIYVELYTNGGLSPVSLLHNIYNLDELSRYFAFDPEGDFVTELKEWFNKSKFVKQLSNPSFDLELIEYLKVFRGLEIKEALPDNYFDTICLLFTYGIVYALDKIENEYEIEGLINDYLDNPIYLQMITSFNSKNYTYRVIGDLRKKYSSLNSTKNEGFSFSDDVIILINKLYLEAKLEIDKPLESSNLRLAQIPPKANKILNDLLWDVSNKNITSRVVTNKILALSKIENTESIIHHLNRVKLGFNSKNNNVKNETKIDLINYLNSIIIG